MNERYEDISASEFTELMHRIVATGWGYEAIDKINHLLMEREKIQSKYFCDNKARLVAINKIANSSQTPRQKINGIKPLTEIGGDTE